WSCWPSCSGSWPWSGSCRCTASASARAADAPHRGAPRPWRPHPRSPQGPCRHIPEKGIVFDTMKTLILTLCLAAAPLVARAEVQIVGAPNGQALGRLNGNPYGAESVANPYSRLGNPSSPPPPNNPHRRYGHPYNPDSVTNPYGTGGARVYGAD